MDSQALRLYLHNTLSKNLHLFPDRRLFPTKTDKKCASQVTFVLVNLIANGTAPRVGHLDNTLFNIALDRVSSSEVLVSPVGFIFSPGTARFLAEILAEDDVSSDDGHVSPKALLLPSFMHIRTQHRHDNNLTSYPPSLSAESIRKLDESVDMSFSVRCGVQANALKNLTIAYNHVETMNSKSVDIQFTDSVSIFSSGVCSSMPGRLTCLITHV